MKTTIIVMGDWYGFENFELPNMKHIPQKGEHFEIDHEKYTKQAEITALATERTREVCRVRYVAHSFSSNKHTIEIHLFCGD